MSTFCDTFHKEEPSNCRFPTQMVENWLVLERILISRNSNAMFFWELSRIASADRERNSINAASRPLCAPRENPFGVARQCNHAYSDCRSTRCPGWKIEVPAEDFNEENIRVRNSKIEVIRHPIRIEPDPSRVISRFFSPGDDTRVRRTI